jgi:hypothetical protein
MRLGVITRHDIEAYLVAQREARSKRGKKAERPVLSATTVNYALRILKSILADAVELGDLSENVAARVKPLRSPMGTERTYCTSSRRRRLAGCSRSRISRGGAYIRLRSARGCAAARSSGFVGATSTSRVA